MDNRRPAGPFFGRPLGALARSPAERLEPTRPTARPKRHRVDREPGTGRPIIRFLSGVLTLVLLLMLLVGGVAFLFDSQIDAPGPLPRPKVVVIPKGEGAHEIGMRLEREGAVSDRRLFVGGYVWTRFTTWLENGKPVQLKAGEYQVPQSASVRQIVDIMAEGKTVFYRVTVPEGLTSHQIVERLKADPNLSGEIAEVPGEGTLLPETFSVQRGSARQAILDKMQAEAKKLTENAWAQRKKDLPLKSWEEVLVLASIVEKETGRNDERERVAAVFVNRLRQNMRLQSDPTILYGMHGGKVVWNRPIQRTDIAQKTAHNTYQVDGLPPTPICNPGKAAIEAVLNPADTKELYFVADGSGGHVFAENLKDHNANVLKWRAVERDMKAKAAPAQAPAPGDTPTTAASPPTRAVVRTLPPKGQPAPAPPEKAKAPAKAPPAAPGDDATGQPAWSSTTSPTAPKQKR